jgi:hypothetical protein
VRFLGWNRKERRTQRKSSRGSSLTSTPAEQG